VQEGYYLCQGYGAAAGRKKWVRRTGKGLCRYWGTNRKSWGKDRKEWGTDRKAWGMGWKG